MLDHGERLASSCKRPGREETWFKIHSAQAVLGQAWGMPLYQLGIWLESNIRFSSPFDLLVEWRGVRKRLPRVVAPEGAYGQRLLQAASSRP